MALTQEELQAKIDRVESDPSVSYWLKQAWRTIKGRDPVDAIEDVECLADICMAKWIELKGNKE